MVTSSGDTGDTDDTDDTDERGSRGSSEAASGPDSPAERRSAEASSPSLPTDPSAMSPYTHTRASGLWASVVVALLVLLVLAVFILENGQHVKVGFFGSHGTLPLGVALLLAAVFGGLVVVLAGTVRILQLRRRSRRQERSHRHGRSASSAG